MKAYFPKLRSAQVVEKALDRICANDIIGVIVGSPGCGRTAALGHWRRTRATPHIWIEATLCGTLQATVGALAEGLQITRGSIDSTATHIAERLAEKPIAVFFDEFDFACPAALNKLRAIWDRAQMIRDTDDERGFPLALLGTHVLRTRLTLDEERSEQMLRRIGEFDEVPTLNMAEIQGVLLAKWQLARGTGNGGQGTVELAEGAAEEALRLCRGSIGWLNKIIPIALDLAAKDGKVVTAKIIRATSRNLAGLEER
jgi:hypothetical protein